MVAVIRAFKQKKLRLSEMLYALALFLFPLFSANNLIGIARYGTVIIPLFTAAALSISGRRFARGVYVTLAICQALLVIFWALGWMVML